MEQESLRKVIQKDTLEFIRSEEAGVSLTNISLADNGCPVPHTCPAIDSVQAAITQSVKDVEYARSVVDICKPHTSEGAHSLLEDIDGILDSVLYILWEKDREIEEIRDANHALRSWGEMQRDKVDILTKENKELKEKIHKTWKT